MGTAPLQRRRVRLAVDGDAPPDGHRKRPSSEAECPQADGSMAFGGCEYDGLDEWTQSLTR